MLIHTYVNRITDASTIEARLLELAHTTDATLTAPALAYYAPCSLDDAARVLENLAARDQLTMHVDDDGAIRYELPGRQKLALATMPAVLTPAWRDLPPRRHASPLVAAALSAFVLPGAGHVYAGRVVAGLLWFLVVALGYTLIVPGLVLHLFSIVSAAGAAARHNLPAPTLWLAAPSHTG
jgi:TM2 domain-containing membrane protein YozV